MFSSRKALAGVIVLWLLGLGALALTQSQGRADIRLLDSSEMRDVAKGALVPFDLGKFRLRYLKPHGPFLPGEPSTR